MRYLCDCCRLRSAREEGGLCRNCNEDVFGDPGYELPSEQQLEQLDRIIVHLRVRLGFGHKNGSA